MEDTTYAKLWDKLNRPELGALNDFRVVLFLIWAHLNLPKPTRCQLDISTWLQEAPSYTNGRMVLEAFRGVGKTWVTVAFVCYCLLKCPNIKVLIVSKTEDKAKEIIFLIKRILREMPIFQHLNPELSERCTTEYFDVIGCDPDVQPSVKALGIEGQLPGNRADIIIADDVETRMNSLTVSKREKLDKDVAEFDAIIKPGGIIIFLGTPQSEDSLYTRRARAGYTMRIWPAMYPSASQMTNEAYRSRLAPWIVRELEADKSLEWTPTDSARFSREDLHTREISFGRAGFLLQFQLDTSLSDAERYPLRLKDALTMAFDPTTDKCPVSLIWSNDLTYAIKDESLPMVGMTGDRWFAPAYVSSMWEPFERTVMAIDPSGSGQDETGWAVVSLYKGWLFDRATGGFVDGHSETTMKELAKVAEKFKVDRIRIEKNFGDGMYTQLLKPHLAKIHPCEIVEERSSGQKERRMCDILEPVMLSHRLIFLESVIREDYKVENPDYQLFYQMTRLTRERGALNHDDRVDALAMAVADLVEYMSQDTQTTEDEHKRQIAEKFIRAYMESLEGKPQVLDNSPMRYIR